MKEGDFLTCKENVYNEQILSDSISLRRDYCNKKVSKLTTIFSETILKKGNRYKIDRIGSWYSGPSGSTYNNRCYKEFECHNYYINGIKFSDAYLNKVFYTQKEERNLKLKKLNESK